MAAVDLVREKKKRKTGKDTSKIGGGGGVCVVCVCL
jgi:hypothetical protein